MAGELVIHLDATFQSGLDVDALLYAGDSLAETVQLAEEPIGSGRYRNSGSLGLAAGTYDVAFVDRTTGDLYGVEATAFIWDGAARVGVDAATAAAILNVDRALLDVAGGFAKRVLDKVGLLSASQQIEIAQVAEQVVRIYKGGSHHLDNDNALIFPAPVAVRGDLAGYRALLALEKLVSTTGDAAVQFEGVVDNPGTEDQRLIFELTALETTTLAVDRDFVSDLALPTGRAYAYSVSAANSHRGTAQAGAAGTITLAADAPEIDGFYDGQTIEITAGTGEGQERTIDAYTGATRVATVTEVWEISPDATSVYHVKASRCPLIREGEASVHKKRTDCG